MGTLTAENINWQSQHFPGGLVVKNPPVNARGLSLIPGPGRSHTLGQISHAPPQLGLCSRAQEPQIQSPHVQLLKPVNPRAHALQLEKPL